MVEIELSKYREGVGRTIEYVTLETPLNSPRDVGCSKPDLLSFDEVRQIAELLQHGQRTGDIAGWIWRVL
jgi:hypothetical protein